MKLDINNIFILTKYNLDMLNEILEFSRPNRSFKSKTAALIKDSLKLRDTVFNPIVYKNKIKQRFNSLNILKFKLY